jgi:hypothetical protein
METNKNKKYSSDRERRSLLKKTNVTDKATLFTNIRNVISAIKAKHLS